MFVKLCIVLTLYKAILSLALTSDSLSYNFLLAKRLIHTQYIYIYIELIALGNNCNKNLVKNNFSCFHFENVVISLATPALINLYTKFCLYWLFMRCFVFGFCVL